MQTIINICLQKNKSKQSYVWIDSIFKAQSICFGTEIAGILDFSYNKYALVDLISLKNLNPSVKSGIFRFWCLRSQSSIQVDVFTITAKY